MARPVDRYSYGDSVSPNPVTGSPFTAGLSTEHAAAVIVFGSLAFLILVRRGFRGVGPIKLG